MKIDLLQSVNASQWMESTTTAEVHCKSSLRKLRQRCHSNTPQHLPVNCNQNA